MQRITVTGKGCSGLEVEIIDDAQQLPNDKVVEFKGKSYLVDEFTSTLIEFFDGQIAFVVPRGCTCAANNINNNEVNLNA